MLQSFNMSNRSYNKFFVGSNDNYIIIIKTTSLPNISIPKIESKTSNKNLELTKLS